MSRRSRRKTISHADLEDFLCDLGDEDVVEDLMDVDKSELLLVGNSSVSLTGKENMTDEQRVREFHKVRNLPIDMKNIAVRIIATADRNIAVGISWLMSRSG